MTHDRKMGTVVVGSRERNMSKDEVLIEGEFEVFPRDKVLYKLECKRTGITYYPINGDKSNGASKYIHFEDVIGCRCRKSLDQKHSNKAYLTIFSYPLRKKLFSDKYVRYKNHITFAHSSDSNFESNRKCVEKWRRVILHLCQKLPLHKQGNPQTFLNNFTYNL